MPPNHEGMIFVFTGFAERQTCPFEPHVSRGWGDSKNLGSTFVFRRNSARAPGPRAALLYRTSALRTAKHAFNARPPSAGRREMGSGTPAFNPCDPHGPYALRSYRTAGESATRHRMSGSPAACQAPHGEGSAGMLLLSRYFYFIFPSSLCFSNALMCSGFLRSTCPTTTQ
jgi:hypothetical protein